MKNFLSLIILVSLLFLPVIALALELRHLQLEYPEIGGITIELRMDLNRLIAWFYFFIVRIAGFAAFIMLVWAGIKWMTSAGDASKITDAKDQIYSALLGLVIILGSYLILQIINPELVTLRLPELPEL